jgi:hypothetical protein
MSLMCECFFLPDVMGSDSLGWNHVMEKKSAYLTHRDIFFVCVQGGGESPIHQIHKQMVSPSCAASERSLAKQILLCQATCGWAFLVCLVLCGE